MRVVPRPYATGVAVVLVALLAALGVTLLHEDHRARTPIGRRPPKPTTSVAQHTVLAVKIDNVDAARPQTGVASADVVYVEPVEGGLTRLVAVYGSHRPNVVGPVRSARPTDLELLAQYGRPTLAYSGAAPPLLTLLRSASVVNASPVQAPGAYYRSSSRLAPHNLYLRPAELPAVSLPGLFPSAPTGAAPTGGPPAARHRVGYPAAIFDFQWSSGAGRWLVSMNGTPFIDTSSGQVAAATVVVQKVAVRVESSAKDSSGSVTPTAQTVGHGACLVLRDGKTFQATWSRPTAQEPTTYTTSDGRGLPLSPGPVWIMLVPA